jgi:hypothetical protein
MSDGWFYAMGNINPSGARGGQSSLSMNDCKGGYYHTQNYGNATPTLGTGGASWVPSGWTQITGGNVDDGNWGFNNIMAVEIAGGLQGPIYVGSNSYITFGAGYNTYGGLSGSNPPSPKIHIAAADRSVQRLAYRWYDPIGNLNVRHLRIRFEGHSSAGGGVVGSPTLVWEAIIFSRWGYNGNQIFEVRTGTVNLGSGMMGGSIPGEMGVASSSAYYSSVGVYANLSYVWIGSNSGTSWTYYGGRRDGVPT